MKSAETKREAARIRSIVICGPDGSGKSALASAIGSRHSGRSVIRLHHRPGVLPKRGKNNGPVTEPHRLEPYGASVSCLKVLYIFADYVLGWWCQVRPALRRGGLLVLERGWWDMQVDPRRYRLRKTSGLVNLLGHFLPKPDIVLVLNAPAPVLLERKCELPGHELDRQNREWQRSIPTNIRHVVLDAREPQEQILAKVEALLESSAATTNTGRDRWVSLPSRVNERWLLSCSTPRKARTSLTVYQPVTPRGLIAWEAARAAAATGAFRLLPRSREPSAQALQSIPTRYQDRPKLAIARANHMGRWVGLVDDGGPAQLVVVKVATTERGHAALAAEAAALVEATRYLPPTLRAPKLLHQEPGALALEFVPWCPRLRPWVLPEQVASGLGQLFVNGRASSTAGRGYAHGDCAPWNLLRAEEGWYLCDWESAGPNGLPFEDVFHYVVQGHALLGRPARSTILSGLKGKGWVGRSLGAFAEAAGLRMKDAPDALHDYIVKTRSPLSESKPDEKKGIIARQSLLAVLEKAGTA